MGKNSKNIDYYKTAKKISNELRKNPDLKVYKRDDSDIEVEVVEFTDDSDANKEAVMKYITSNKNKEPKKRRALFVYDGFGPDAKLIPVSKVSLKKTKAVVKANDLTLINPIGKSK